MNREGFLVSQEFLKRPNMSECVMLVFRDSLGPIYCDFLEGQRAINSRYYMLKHQVKSAINSRPHAAQLNRDSSRYSLELVSSDFFSVWTTQRRPTWKNICQRQESQESGVEVASANRMNPLPTDI